MKLLLSIILLTLSTTTFSQTTKEKEWKIFWNKFVIAVNSKNINTIKKISKNDGFWTGDPEESRDEYLNNLDTEQWKGLLKSVKSGYKSDGLDSKSTKDNFLKFDYENNKWLFSGISGG